jgi:hypothetical protein
MSEAPQERQTGVGETTKPPLERCGIDGRSTRWLRRRLAGPGYDRLESELETYCVEFGAFVGAMRSAGVGPRGDPAAEHWSVDHVFTLLKRADAHLGAGRIQRGWNCLHAARRVEYYAYEAYDRAGEQPSAAADGGEAATARPDDASGTAGAGGDGGSALRTRAVELRREAADRLTGWRREAAEDLLLDGDGGLRTDLSAIAVLRARHLIDQANENNHTKRRFLQRQLRLLLGFGVLTLLAFLVAAFRSNPLAVADVTSATFVAFVPLVGALGASLFGVRSVWKTATSTKVPQSFTPFQVVLARLFVGSVSAIVLYLGLSAGIVQVANVSGTSATVLLTVAFAAGYSERFAPQAIERVSQLSGGEASSSSKRGG